jgi:putative membrane protein
MSGRHRLGFMLAIGVAALSGAASAQSGGGGVAPSLPTPPPNETGAASAGNPSATSETAPGTRLISRGAGTAGISQDDRNFVGQAAQYATAEIDAGRLALKYSHTPKVITFARQAVETGEATLAPIQKIAGSIGIKPNDEHARAEDETQQLKAAQGTVFDGLYGDLEARDQQDMMALYSKEAASGENQQLKSFASVQRQHIDVTLLDARLLKQGTIDRENPNCNPNGPAKLGCP